MTEQRNVHNTNKTETKEKDARFLFSFYRRLNQMLLNIFVPEDSSYINLLFSLRFLSEYSMNSKHKKKITRKFNDDLHLL